MHSFTTLSVAFALAPITLGAPAQDAEQAAQYLRAHRDAVSEARVVTQQTPLGTLTRYVDARIPKVEAATTKNWERYGSDLKNTRYLDARQVTPANVKSLRLAWGAETIIPNPTHGETRAAQATPIVVGGIMYVPDLAGNVWAFDAVTGQPIWRMTLSEAVATNEVHGFLGGTKGLVHADGVVYVPVGASLFALDALTGAPVATFGGSGRCEAVLQVLRVRYPTIQRPRERGYYIPMVPQYHNGVLYAVAGIGEATPAPTGGLIIAIDAKTGAVLWYFNTIPQDATEPGWNIASATWAGTGGRTGGSVWQTPAIDPELGLLYVCVANPTPVSNGTQRRGMNLFTDSVLALDIASGRLKAGWGTDMDGDGVGDGFFQAVHHDIWDFDWAMNPVLFESTIDGRSVKALASAGKFGLLFMLDRTTGKPLPGFSIVELPVTASTVVGEETWPTQPFPFNPAGEGMAAVPLIGTDIPQSRIDQGYVLAAPYTPANTFARQITAPSGALGGTVGPASFSPDAGLLYVGGIDSPTNSGRSTRSFITAWNVNTGSIVWGRKVNGNFSAGNGSAATAGGLVFFGESAGILHGVDGYTGEELWTFSSGVSGSKGAPLVYEVNGKQYVSIKSGNFVLTFSLPD